MPLKFKIAKKEDVPAEHASLYREEGGAFVLDVEGAVDKSKLEEFRQNNINLTNQLKAFEGLDVEKAKELLKKQEELDSANLIKSGDIPKIIDAKLNPVLQQLTAEKNRTAQLQAQLEETTLTKAVTEAGTKRGVRASAVADLQARAKAAFKVVNGVPVSNDGSETTLDAWVDSLVTSAAHLFETNAGGGADSNGSGGAGSQHGQKNPWKQETWNLTEQSRIARHNPNLAASLRKAAGR